MKIEKTEQNPHGWSLPVPQAMPEENKCAEVIATCEECEKTYRVLEKVTGQTDNEVIWTCISCTRMDQVLSVRENVGNVVKAYRSYYQSESKAKLAVWKNSCSPSWFMLSERPFKKIAL